MFLSTDDDHNDNAGGMKGMFFKHLRRIHENTKGSGFCVSFSSLDMRSI